MTKIPLLIKVSDEHAHRKLKADKTLQGLNIDTDNMATVYKKFGLDSGTQDFIGKLDLLPLIYPGFLLTTMI